MTGQQRTDEAAPARTAYLVKQLELAVRAHIDAAARPHGLTTTQYTALAALRRIPGQSSAQLARRSFVSAQTMQELISGLERRGLIERTQAPTNKRVLRIHLTEQGERVLDGVDGEVDAIERTMLADLDPAQVERFRDSLRLCARRLATFPRT
nr:MarR family transcriptional regulator [Saccharomonospora saliphila]